jgi:hypothetical protein
MLKLTLPSGVTCEASLPPRYTRLLLACAEAWQEDEGNSERFRGFRSNEVIAARLGELSPSEGNAPLDPKMVRVYVYELGEEISKAVSSLAPKGRSARAAPALIENLRACGYRIAACGLDIVPPVSGV